MKLFKCRACGNILYFENRNCGRCGHRLGFLPEQSNLSALEPAGDGRRTVLAATEQPRFLCANAGFDACNWLVPPGTADKYCLACRHNSIIPNLNTEANLAAWRLMELAKHRLFYSLLRWRLPLQNRIENPQYGLAFEFLRDDPVTSGPRILTGHEDGKIVIALAEADDAEREKRRQAMHEPYRTLLGHFRHEVGHHYWDVLVRDWGKLEAFRAVFGDDSQDYGQALQLHYQNGSPADWQNNYVSEYATTHPWEDFAETWAHYLHIVDTLETAGASGLTVRPPLDDAGDHTAAVKFDPYCSETLRPIIDAWLPYVFAINSVSRAMGERDLYPFVLAAPVIGKLDFVCSATIWMRTARQSG